MAYQRLDPFKNEIRLLYPEYPYSPITSIDPPRLQMRTVSLDSYNEDIAQSLEVIGQPTYEAYRDRVWAAVPGNDHVEAFVQFHRAPKLHRWSWGEFSTLSYAWGEATQTQSIYVNDIVMDVTENLWEFLQVLCSSKGVSGLEQMGFWIDAICINQGNIAERSAQVARMGTIYSLAWGAVIWLGKGIDSSSDAIHDLSSLGTAISYSQAIISQEEKDEFVVSYLNDKTLWRPGTWRTLLKLVSRPYWSRLWIMQEIAMSGHRINVICGDSWTLRWSHFVSAVSYFSNNRSLVQTSFEQECPALQFPGAILLLRYGFERIDDLSELRDVINPNVNRFASVNMLLEISKRANSLDPRDKACGYQS